MRIINLLSYVVNCSTQCVYTVQGICIQFDMSFAKVMFLRYCRQVQKPPTPLLPPPPLSVINNSTLNQQNFR